MTVVAKADLRFADLDLAAGFEMYWGFDDDAVIAGTIGGPQIMKPERIALLPHFSMKPRSESVGYANIASGRTAYGGPQARQRHFVRRTAGMVDDEICHL